MRLNLEQKLEEAINLNDNLEAEVNRLRNQNSSVERDFRAQMDDARQNERDLERDLRNELDAVRREGRDNERELRAELEDARRNERVGGSQARDLSRSDSRNRMTDERGQQLEMELDEQRRVTDEVRRDAARYMQDMRLMAQTSADALEKEERFRDQVSVLEREVRDWKNKYAAAKTRERSLRASSLGLPAANDDSKHYAQFMSPDGAVRDVLVTTFKSPSTSCFSSCGSRTAPTKSWSA